MTTSKSPTLQLLLTEIDECKSSPCLNGGTCVDGVYNFTCVCPSWFIGKRCEGSITLKSYYVVVFGGLRTVDGYTRARYSVSIRAKISDAWVT